MGVKFCFIVPNKACKNLITKTCQQLIYGQRPFTQHIGPPTLLYYPLLSSPLFSVFSPTRQPCLVFFSLQVLRGMFVGRGRRKRKKIGKKKKKRPIFRYSGASILHDYSSTIQWVVICKMFGHFTLLSCNLVLGHFGKGPPLSMQGCTNTFTEFLGLPLPSIQIPLLIQVSFSFPIIRSCQWWH